MRLDMRPLLEQIDELKEILTELDGEEVNVEVRSHKNLMARKAEVNRDLLYAAHVADEIRVGVMREYHNFKAGAEGPRR